MKKLTLYFGPLLVSSLVMIISQLDQSYYEIFWKFFNVPPQWPPFSDLDAISKAVDSKLAGYDPYIKNPFDLKGMLYVYPSIWLKFFEIFNLNVSLNFKIFNFIIIYFYCLVYFDLSLKINNKFFYIISLVMFFSSANMLAIERLNIELIIFIFIYYLSISKKNYIKIPIFILAIYAKLYPLFAIFIFCRNKKILFTMILASFLVLFSIRDEILMLIENGNEVALNIAYGVPTLTKGIWYYSTKFGYFITSENYNLFKNSMIFLASIFALIIVLYSFKFRDKTIFNNFSIEEKLFISGAGIFIGRFLTASNVDYSLIFLFFTIPYYLKLENSNLKLILITVILFIFFGALFEFGDRYTIGYALRAALIHSLKIIVFSFMCYFFGKVLNNHLKL